MSERLDTTAPPKSAESLKRLAKGVFITIEGSDGSGKGTQFKIIGDRFTDLAIDVGRYDFPDYENESSYFAREYLNGNYGDANELGAYVPSIFFALDRFDSASNLSRVNGNIRQDLIDGKLVFSNRFIGSNMAHQGQKIDDEAELEKYYQWLYSFEFDLLKTPKPDLNIVLHVPADIAQLNVDKKGARGYTDKTRDIHEADINHLNRSVAAYKRLSEQFPEQFTLIECTENGEMLSEATVTALIWDKIQPLLGDVAS